MFCHAILNMLDGDTQRPTGQIIKCPFVRVIQMSKKLGFLTAPKKKFAVLGFFFIVMTIFYVTSLLISWSRHLQVQHVLGAECRKRCLF